MNEMTFTKKELELLAKACLFLAADESTSDEDMDILDYLSDNLAEMAEEMEDEWDD